jgi:hypothetical protein
VLWNRSSAPVDRLAFHLYANAYASADTAFARDRGRLSAYDDPRSAVPTPASAGSIRVAAVRVDGRPVDPLVNGTIAWIPIAGGLAPGECVSVALDFHVRIPRFRDRLSVNDDSFAVGAWFPKLAVLDDRGWDAGERRGLGEFYSDVGDYQVAITVPTGFIVQATGSVIASSSTGAAAETTRWSAQDVRDFAWVADRRYRVSRAEWQGIVVRYAARPGHERTAADGLRVAIRALEYFSECFGRYPYGEFTVAETPALPPGSGVEYPQLVMISEELAVSGRFMTDFPKVVAHETAHQWWYGVVGNNEAEDAWLDEGLATYSARRFLQATEGREPPIFRWPGPLRFLPSPTERDLARSTYSSRARAGFDEPVRQPAAAFTDRAN